MFQVIIVILLIIRRHLKINNFRWGPHFLTTLIKLKYWVFTSAIRVIVKTLFELSLDTQCVRIKNGVRYSPIYFRLSHILEYYLSSFVV